MEIINPKKFTPHYSDIPITPTEIRTNAILDQIADKTNSYDVKGAWAAITTPEGDLYVYDIAHGIDPKLMQTLGIREALNQATKDLDLPNYRVQENEAVK